jgi:hypothetical protein
VKTTRRTFLQAGKISAAAAIAGPPFTSLRKGKKEIDCVCLDAHGDINSRQSWSRRSRNQSIP